MIKRPLVWVLAGYCTGIFCWDLSEYIVPVVVITYIILGVLLIKKPKLQRFFRDGNRCLLCVPIALLLGALLTGQQQRDYAIDAVLDGKTEATVSGRIESVAVYENGSRICLAEAVVTLVEAGDRALPDISAAVQEELEAGSFSAEQGSKLYREGKVLLWTGPGEERTIGEWITAAGSCQPLVEPENPGQFDEKQYYRASGVACKFQAETLQVRKGSKQPFRSWCQRVRRELGEVFHELLPETHAGIMTAILLGDRSGLEEDITELYRKNGIAHILAISGLHISLIGYGLFSLLRRFKSPLLPAVGITVLLLLSYGFLTEFGVSTKRAVGMLILAMLAKLLGRSYDSRNALALCAFAILLPQPMQLFLPGFQLSFAAAYGISCFSAELRRMKLCSEKTVQEKLRTALLSGLTVQMITIPVLLNAYYEISAYSILLNLIVVPLLSILVVLGLAAGLTGLLFPGPGRLLAGGVYYILELYELLCRAAEQLPGAIWSYGKPEGIQLAVYYGILGCFFLAAERIGVRFAGHPQAFRKRRYAGLCLLLLPLVFIRLPEQGMKLSFLSVGQGDCCVLQSETGHAYLIDCGSSSLSSVGKYRLEPFLKHEGISELEAVFLTHADADHSNGILELMERGEIRVRRLILPAAALSAPEKIRNKYEQLVLSAKEQGIPVSMIATGDRVTDGALELTCLHPDSEYWSLSGNAYSMTLLLTCGELDCILTGDLEPDGEQEVMKQLQQAGGRSIDLLKVAHHGSNSTSTEELLRFLQPKVSVISCGKNNSYGHPHREVIERLLQVGSRNYITAEGGAIQAWLVEDNSKTLFKIQNFCGQSE